MPIFDRFLLELRRAGEPRLILASDSEPLFSGPKGERTFGARVGHREVTTLVEEIVPPAKFADLVMMEPVTFDLTVEGGELGVRVVPGPSIWRVTFTAKGGRLDPLPEPGEGEDGEDADGDEGAGEPEQGAAGTAARKTAGSSPKSWSEIERLVDREPSGGAGAGASASGSAAGAEKAATAASGAPPLVIALDEGAGGDEAGATPEGAPEAGEGGVGPELESTDADGDGDADFGVLVTPPPGEDGEPEEKVRDAAGERGAAEGRRGSKETGREARQSWRSLEGALVHKRDTGEVEVLVTSEDEERRRRRDAFATGSTVQLSVEDLATVATSASAVATGRDRGEGAAEEIASRGTIRVPRPAPLDPELANPLGAGGAHSGGQQAEAVETAPQRRSPSGAFGPVEPIEIDLREDEVPTVPIEALDRLLDRAWRAGATALLLRDRRTPAMGHAGRVSPLPGAEPDEGRLVHDLLDLAASPSHVDQLDIEGFCRFVYRPGGSGNLVRCTLVRDGGAVAAWLRRIGDEHLPALASRWLPASVRNVIPESGLVLVAGAAGQGKTTTASALAAMCHQAMDQTLVVADPLERRLPDDGVGILQRQIPEDVPNAGRALGDALRLEARLVLVDVPRPEAVAVDLLTLAGQGRLVIATWTAPSCAAAVEALMDALPANMPQVERARRTRNLRSVVAVRLVPARERGVLPIFETLPINHVVLTAVTEARLGHHAASGAQDLVSLSFEASQAALKSRGLI